MFLQNHWYAAAWDHEIKGQPFARTICGENVVLFRLPDRSLGALEDCCPHRLMPLSKGFLRRNSLVCGYHGLEFNGGGQCVHMPNQQGIHREMHVRTYPVAERHRFVWVWIGDPSLAHEDKIPDLHQCSDPAWVFDGASYHVRCNYVLLVDNLMDLSHETYVHPTSIGQLEIIEAPARAESDEHSVTLTRWMHNIEPPPFWAANLKSTEKCDRWQICQFSLPANVMIDVGVALAGSGAPQGNRSKGVTGIVVNLMTPETETSTWYFWGMTRNFDIDDRGLTGRIRDAQAKVFGEDLAILEAQQESMLRRPDRQPINLNIDAGGVYARRIMDREGRK